VACIAHGEVTSTNAYTFDGASVIHSKSEIYHHTYMESRARDVARLIALIVWDLRYVKECFLYLHTWLRAH